MIQGPTRKQIQRQAPVAIIGPPPRSSGTPDTPYYHRVLAEKLERDHQANLAKFSRPRIAGPMKPRSRGDAIRNGNGDGSFNGGGYSPPAVNGAGAPAGAEFWKNPYYLAAVAAALFWWMRRNKK